MADANFSDVSLLLRCNGADASTSIVDESNNGFTATVLGSAQLDTAQKKYGSASLLIASSGSRVKFPDDDKFEFGTGAFTLELWVRLTTSIVTNEDEVTLLTKNDSSYRSPFTLAFDGFNFSFRAWNTSNAEVVSLYDTTAVSANTWYHLAVTRSGNTFRLFVDGVAAGSATSSASLQSTAETVCVGAYNDGFLPANGCWLDDVRITKGVARYTATFTPPTEHELGTPPPHEGLVSAPGPLGTPTLLGTAGRVNGRISVPGPLGSAGVWGYTSPERRTRPRPLKYVMDLATPGGAVRVPIASWQATLQTDAQCYIQCVVPAAQNWVSQLTEATAFTVFRVLQLDDGSAHEFPVAQAPLQTLALDRGSFNFSATLSGYTPAYTANADPPALADRNLRGERLRSTYSSGMRVRCAYDYLLQPGFRAWLGDVELLPGYMNVYVTGDDEYMDVGERQG